MASELRVDKIIPSSGTSIGIGTTSGTINFLGTSQINTTGVVTASSFSGSGANLTSIPAGNLTGTIADARFPATLPAASAANLTSIPAANVTGTLPAISGANLTSLPAANLTGTLPAISGANLTGISGGLSEADSWRISSTFQGDAYHITSNWERFDASGEGKKGTGMTQSGGYFTFPSTSYWYLHFSATFYRGGSSTIYNQYAHIRTTTDNSSYSERARGVGSMYSSSGNSGSGASAETIFKCENTSTHKVIFGVEVGNQYVYTYGNTNNSMTNVVFIKLADI